MCPLLLVLVVCALTASGALESDWNQSTRDQILNSHNEYRRNEGGCQINKLEYDMELENQAKKWAQGCVFKHEMVEGRGENLAWSTFKHPESQLVTDAAQAWFDEKKDYRPGQRGCQRSCHYTQMVWYDTQKVGCYSNWCPYLQGAAPNSWYFVCFYTPMGNWVGKEPYQTQCDAPCQNGQTQDNGLCVGDVIVPCVDDNASCAGWAERDECSKNPNYMLKYCRKACGECQ